MRRICGWSSRCGDCAIQAAKQHPLSPCLRAQGSSVQEPSVHDFHGLTGAQIQAVVASIGDYRRESDTQEVCHWTAVLSGSPLLSNLPAGNKKVSPKQREALSDSGLLDNYDNRPAALFRAFQNTTVLQDELHIQTKHGLKQILQQELWPDLVESMLVSLAAAQADPAGTEHANPSDVMGLIEQLHICTDGRQFGITSSYVAGRLAEAYAPQQVAARRAKLDPTGQYPSSSQGPQHDQHLLSLQQTHVRLQSF